MKKPITKYFVWYIGLCVASVLFSYIIAHLVVAAVGAIQMYVIAIISAVVPLVFFFLTYIGEHFDHYKGIFQYIPILIFSVFGSNHKYVPSYEYESAQRRHLQEKYLAEHPEENIEGSSENKKKKKDLDAEYYADQIERDNKLQGKSFYLALIPVAIIFVAATIVFAVLFNYINAQMAGYVSEAVETGSKLSNNYFVYAVIVEILCGVSVTSFVYLFIGLYQVKARTCPKCGGYMSYVEVKLLDTKTEVDNQTVTRKKTYDAGSVYIDDERYSVTAVEYKNYLKRVDKTTDKTLCKCKFCEMEKIFKDVSITRYDEVEK